MKLKEKYNVKLITTGHGGEVYKYPFENEFTYKNTKSVLENSDYITTVSASNYNILKEKYNVKKNKMIIIENGFDDKLFHLIPKDFCRKKLNIDLNKKIILHIGNLVYIKNQTNLILAFNELHKLRPDTLLYIVGDGP